MSKCIFAISTSEILNAVCIDSITICSILCFWYQIACYNIFKITKYIRIGYINYSLIGWLAYKTVSSNFLKGLFIQGIIFNKTMLLYM